MTSETIAKALGGRKIGTGWLACCPAHDDVNPSLSITTGKDGKVLLHCHVGCKQSRVIDMLRSRGLWKSPDRRSGWRPLNKRHQSTDFAIAENNENRTKSALRIWEATVLADGTLAEIYTKSRGLRFQLPKTLRFHPHLKHPSGSRWPALVALISSGLDNIPIAIHRTFLTPDGLGKAPVVPQKMMLGPCRGGAVRLGSHGDLLMVGEGLETCLAAMQATGNPAWAALSTAGLRALDLPDDVHEVILLADGDDPGEAAARDCALRWQREGRHVRIARPPQGLDFNDMLLGRGHLIKEGSAQ